MVRWQGRRSLDEPVVMGCVVARVGVAGPRNENKGGLTYQQPLPLIFPRRLLLRWGIRDADTTSITSHARMRVYLTGGRV